MTERRKVKRLMRIWGVVCIIAIILGYGLFQSLGFMRGPQIEITYPLNGTVVHDALIEIQGTAQNISYLTLNNNKIFTDEAGLFKEKTLLSRGYNVMTLKAQDRFGRTMEKTLQLIYK